MTLVATREKLKPFVDEGVVCKDRKRDPKKDLSANINPKKAIGLEERLTNYRLTIIEFIQQKNYKGLESLVKEFTMAHEDPENNYLADQLQYDIILCQLYLKRFAEWKEEQTSKLAQETKYMFNEAILIDIEREKAKEALDSIQEFKMGSSMNSIQ